MANGVKPCKEVIDQLELAEAATISPRTLQSRKAEENPMGKDRNTKGNEDLKMKSDAARWCRNQYRTRMVLEDFAKRDQEATPAAGKQ